MDDIARIVVVDDDPSLLFATARILKSAGYEVSTAAGGAEGLEKIREVRPDLVLLDVVMPDIDGRTVCRRIKSDPTLRGTYVILLSSMQTMSDQQAEGLESGADGYIARPVEKRELLARVESMLRIKQIQTDLLHDPLTALPNRHLFEDRLEQAIRKTQRSGGQAALLYLDLDGFKPVNDIYGHDAGDIVLREVAVRIQSCIRTSDTAARIGGDEFVVILPDVEGREDALMVSQKISNAIRQPFPVIAQECCVGVSIGISLFPDDGTDIKTLMKVADQAMYEVKKQRQDGEVKL
jgi:two-component system cell cycle response regulator